MDKLKYISVDEFANYSNVSKKTILKNLSCIPGTYIDEKRNVCIPIDSHYPYKNRGNIKVDSKYKIIYILKALNNYQYLDYKFLKMNESDFQNLIDSLIAIKFIEKNLNSTNPYGTNPYSITLKGREFLDSEKDKNNEKLFKNLIRILQVVESGFQVITKVLSLIK